MKLLRVFGYYWQFIYKQLWQYSIIFVTISISKIILIVAVPSVYKEIIDEISVFDADTAGILYTLFFFAILAIICTHILSVIGNYMRARTMPQTLANVVEYAVKRVSGHSYSFFADSMTGSLLTKINKFRWGFVQVFVHSFDQIWISVLSIIVVFATLLYHEPILAFVLTVWVFVHVGITAILVHYQIPKEEKRAEYHSKVDGICSDMLSNFSTVKMFGTQKIEERRFKKAEEESKKVREVAWIQTHSLE